MTSPRTDPNEAEFAKHRDKAEEWLERADVVLAQDEKDAEARAAVYTLLCTRAQVHATLALAYATRGQTDIQDHWGAQVASELGDLGRAVDSLGGAVDGIAT